MFLPPSNYKKVKKNIGVSIEQPICLRSQHLVIHKDIVELIFKEDRTIYMVFYSNTRQLMIAPYFNDLFRTIHKAKQYMMKEVGSRQENVIALHGIILDNDIAVEDRFLDFEAPEALGVLTVFL